MDQNRRERCQDKGQRRRTWFGGRDTDGPPNILSGVEKIGRKSPIFFGSSQKILVQPLNQRARDVVQGSEAPRVVGH